MEQRMNNDFLPIDEDRPGTSDNQLLMVPFVDNSIFDHAMKMAGTVVEYRELRMMYSCAIKEVRTKFDVLNSEFNVRYQRNPISSITSRLKSSASIMEKLARLKVPFSVDNVNEHLHDVAGIRVICSYVDDIYRLAQALAKQDDITVLNCKDYIKHPKPNGYRSYHMIVSVPVFFSDQTRNMKVEVQIRTIAMDFWASLEHQLKYKKEVPDQQKIVDQLTECATQIAQVDEKMYELRKRIELAEDEPDEEDMLLEKLRRIDLAAE